jgi:prepilin-type processing-associated H-X9-DG protein
VNCTNANEIYGLHPSGANVAFADGSVRTLPAGLDITDCHFYNRTEFVSGHVYHGP